MGLHSLRQQVSPEGLGVQRRCVSLSLGSLSLLRLGPGCCKVGDAEGVALAAAQLALLRAASEDLQGHSMQQELV
jgi:hypothetical protein